MAGPELLWERFVLLSLGKGKMAISCLLICEAAFSISLASSLPFTPMCGTARAVISLQSELPFCLGHPSVLHHRIAFSH